MSEMTYEVGLRIRITEEMSRQLAEAAAATGKTGVFRGEVARREAADTLAVSLPPAACFSHARVVSIARPGRLSGLAREALLQ